MQSFTYVWLLFKRFTDTSNVTPTIPPVPSPHLPQRHSQPHLPSDLVNPITLRSIHTPSPRPPTVPTLSLTFHLLPQLTLTHYAARAQLHLLSPPVFLMLADPPQRMRFHQASALLSLQAMLRHGDIIRRNKLHEGTIRMLHQLMIILMAQNHLTRALTAVRSQ